MKARRSTRNLATYFLIGMSLLAALLLASCAQLAPPPTATATRTATLTPTATATATSTATLTPSLTPTFTLTPLPSLTPTPTLSPTPSDTPTPEPLVATSNGNAFCRWGPDTAYRSSYVIPDGGVSIVYGRNYSATWLWVQPEGLDWKCWVATSTQTLNGDPMQAEFVVTYLPVNTAVPPPSGVTAVRNGNQVTISWNPVPPALEQAYLIEASTCVNGYIVDGVYTTTNTSITLQDATNCGGGSSGKLYNSNKLGYSAPVIIPWP